MAAVAVSVAVFNFFSGGGTHIDNIHFKTNTFAR